MRALTNWVRRLRLKWRRAHTAKLLAFLGDAQRVKISRRAIGLFRHLVVLTQRRVRAYFIMWEARYELAERQFLRVQEVMLQQAARARKGLPMGFRRKEALRRVPRGLTDELAAHKVAPVERAASTSQMRHVLVAHIAARKQKHLKALFAFFERRCEFLRLMRSKGRVEWARAIVHSRIEPTVPLGRFVREMMQIGLHQLERPRYHPVIPTLEMAALVHAAQGSSLRNKVFLT